MMIIIPKRITEMEDELKRKIMAEVYSFAHERGVRLSFMTDSKAIQESINTLATRTVWLIEHTKLDHLLLESMKGAKEMQKATEESTKKKKQIKPMFKGLK